MRGIGGKGRDATLREERLEARSRFPKASKRLDI